MVLLQRYWTMSMPGIPDRESSILKKFIESEFPEFAESQELSPSENKFIQLSLIKFTQFTWKQSLKPRIFFYLLGSQFFSVCSIQSWLAQSSLMCYISLRINKVCEGMAKKYSNKDIKITHLELYSCIFDEKDKKPFILEIIESFTGYSTDLDKLAGIRTYNHQGIGQYLLGNYGILKKTTWGLLNEENKPKNFLEQLTPQEKEILSVFCDVYRQDKINRRKCPTPTENQLDKMVDRLRDKGIYLDSYKLGKQLDKIAKLYRNYKVFKKSRYPAVRVSMTKTDQETGEEYDHPDIRKYSPDLDPLRHKEEKEFDKLIRERDRLIVKYIKQLLRSSIDRELCSLVKEVSKARRERSAYATKVIRGYELLYIEGKSMGYIARQWGVPGNQDQQRLKATRILEPTKLVNNVFQNADLLVVKIVGFVKEQEAKINPDPTAAYFDGLSDTIIKRASPFCTLAVLKGVETLALLLLWVMFLQNNPIINYLNECQQEATKELSNSQEDRQMNSFYAQQMRCYLNYRRCLDNIQIFMKPLILNSSNQDAIIQDYLTLSIFLVNLYLSGEGDSYVEQY